VSGKLDYLFEALSNRHRRDLIAELSKAALPISISDYAKKFKLSLQNAGKHVKLLERANLIARKKVGVENYLTLNTAALAEAQSWLEAHNPDSSLYEGSDYED